MMYGSKYSSALLAFFILFSVPIYSQIKAIAEEQEQLQQEAIKVIKRYSILLDKNATYFNSSSTTLRYAERYKLVDSAFMYPSRIFTSKEASTIVSECDDKLKDDENIASSRMKFYNWLHLRPRTRTHQISISERDICVSKIDPDKKKIHVLFKSKYEIPITNCRHGKVEPRVAIMSYLYSKSQKKWMLTIDAIQFQVERSPCLTPPVITVKPSIAFERPNAQNTTVKNDSFDLKINVQNSENEKSITLMVNGKRIDDFSFHGNSLSHRIHLLEGQNLIRISAINEIGQETKTVQIQRTIEETDPIVTITPEVPAIPAQAPIFPLITMRNPLRSITKDSRINIVATISGIQTQNDITLFINGVEDKEFSYNSLHQIFEKTIDFSTSFSSNQYQVEIEATNALGKKDKKLITLVYEPPAPSNAGEISLLREQITGLENTIRVLKEGKNKAEQTLKKQRRSNSTQQLEMRRQINNLTSNIAKFRTSLNQKKEELRSITKELDSKKKTITNLRQEKNVLQKENRRLAKENRKFLKHDNSKTLYIGINYSLVKTPAGLVFADADLLEGTFDKPTFRQLGIATYYHLGFFVSNLTQISNPTPRVHYTMERVNEIRQELESANIPYQDLHYLYSTAKVNAFTAGVNIYTQIRPIYIKLGVSALWGSLWDVYYGDYRGRLDQDSNGLYAIDFAKINTTDWLAGLAYVGPFFQIEAGYNWLYEDYFLNAGVNVPLVLKRKK